MSQHGETPAMAESTEYAPFSMDEVDIERLLDRLCDIEAPVVTFPVRHHSPAAALLVREAIDRIKPAAVLIEGPSDYNPYRDELVLGHSMPIAIYSYFRTSLGITLGAFYPFCEYSPEWFALQHAQSLGIPFRFIDLPWVEIAVVDRQMTHRYADAELRRGRHVETLCERFEVEDFDDLWDKLVESQHPLSLDDYLRRVHELCFHIRLWDHAVSHSDRCREVYMTDRIREALAEAGPESRVLVVTGGYHSAAIAARLDGFPCPGVGDPEELGAVRPDPAEVVDFGISLTPYSYERLDNLNGYNAGMPNPGFYEVAWESRCSGEPFDHRPLLRGVVEELRSRKQMLSTADLIAVETSARALAALRGRDQIWRRDLVDAVTSALIKDELEYGVRSPFVEAVHAVLRGDRIGKLAKGTRVPPLVHDIRRRITEANLEFQEASKAPSKTRRFDSASKTLDVELNLDSAEDLAASRLLHGLRILEIVGFERVDGTDFLNRDDLTRFWEQWRIRWSPDFERSCIEASQFGTSLDEAVANRLAQELDQQSIGSAPVAATLVRSALAGVTHLADVLIERVRALIGSESRFVDLARTLDHLLFLYCYDDALGTSGLPELGEILVEAYHRALWLLESLGESPGEESTLIRGMQAILEVARRTGDGLDLDRSELTAVLGRVESDPQKPAQVRGAASGILWTLNAADPDRILERLLGFVDPNDLGDFLVGLFALAREVAQRQPQLVQAIDDLLLEYDADDFQVVLPALRLAFTYFTPREKHQILKSLFDSLGMTGVRPLAEVSADPTVAAEALALEERIFEAIAKYDLHDDRTLGGSDAFPD